MIFKKKCLNLRVFANDFEAMNAYPMNEDNCKAHVICSLHHCSHDPMWYDNLCKSIHHAPKKYYL